MSKRYPTEQEMRDALLGRAKEYCAVARIRPSVLERKTGRANGFFKSLAAGRNFTVKTYTEMMTWFDENWPDGTEATEMARQG